MIAMNKILLFSAVSLKSPVPSISLDPNFFLHEWKALVHLYSHKREFTILTNSHFKLWSFILNIQKVLAFPGMTSGEIRGCSKREQKSPMGL